MPKTSNLIRSNPAENLPIFTGAPEPELKPTDPRDRIEWARRALLLSNLETFTAEQVREFVDEMRPDLLGSGRWLGFVFRSPWFRIMHHEHAQRDEAKARWIIRYKLSAEGRAERARLQGGVRGNT